MPTKTAASSRLFSHTDELKAAIPPIMAGAAGFVMSGASILQAAAPFAVAWAGAVAPGLALSATVGAAAGYLILLRGEGALRYIACLLLTLALRWALSFIPKKRVIYYSPLFAAAAIATTGFAAAFIDSGSSFGFVIALCETLITATSGILFGKAQRAIADESCLTHTNSVCMAIFLAALYMGLCSISFFSLSPAVILAIAAVICSGCYARAGISCAAAVCAGICSALAGDGSMLAVYSAGGLAAGAFAPLGKLSCCFAALFASVLAEAAQNGFERLPVIFADAAAACVLSLLIPPSLLRKLGLTGSDDSAEGELLRRLTQSSLCRLAAALSDISKTTDEVSRRVSEIGCTSIDTVITDACSRVCRGCKSSPRCWQTDQATTQDALNHAFSAAKRFGEAGLEDIPEYFECERLDMLLNEINTKTAACLAMRGKQRLADRLRSVSSDQFGGMGELLDSLGERLSKFCSAPPQTSRAITGYLAAKSCEAKNICCYCSGENGLSVSARVPLHRSSQLMTPQVAADLSELAAQELDIPLKNCCGGFADILWQPKANFGIEYSFLQRAAGSGRFCGDSCRVIERTDNRALLLLCDGMGVGGAAAVDAEMTISLIERLLTSGAEFAPALKLANAALLSGGGEERLCTVDAAILDLYDCRLELFKAGAAPTYICRDGRCTVFEAQSLPAGILGGAEAQRLTASLSPDDLVVMVSDGLLEDGGEWLPSQITALCRLPLDEICEGLIETARQRLTALREDDMTVIAARITKA